MQWSETATQWHKRSAVKNPLGARTVLGDRHDLVCENFVASAVGGPAELARENFPAAGDANRFEPSTRLRKRTSFRVCAVGRHVLREFASRAGVCVGEAQHV